MLDACEKLDCSHIKHARRMVQRQWRLGIVTRQKKIQGGRTISELRGAGGTFRMYPRDAERRLLPLDSAVNQTLDSNLTLSTEYELSYFSPVSIVICCFSVHYKP